MIRAPESACEGRVRMDRGCDLGFKQQGVCRVVVLLDHYVLTRRSQTIVYLKVVVEVL